MRLSTALFGVIALSGLMACAKPAEKEEPPTQPVARSEPSESQDAAPRESHSEELAADEALLRAREAVRNAEAKAADEEKQRQTLRDIQSLGEAVQRWLHDAVATAGIHGPIDTSPTRDAGDYPPISHAELEKLLVPQYIASVPETDGWGHPLETRLRTSDFSTHLLFMIRSPGRDGAFSSDTYTYGTFGAEDFDQDVVFVDDYFLRRPESLKPYG